MTEQGTGTRIVVATIEHDPVEEYPARPWYISATIAGRFWSHRAMTRDEAIARLERRVRESEADGYGN